MLRTTIISLALLLTTSAGAQDVPEAPTPTHENVAYGPHERNVLDFWQADGASPTPLVLYFHGGGFIRGRKESLVAPRVGRGSTVSNIEVLQALLDAGISVAAASYRLMPDAPLPASFFDSKRALQFLRSKSTEWNIDKARVGAFGDSAGAVLSMWLALKDEMADPDSIDPVARESSRLTVVANRGGQTLYDEERWLEWIPGLSEPPPTLTNMLFESDDPVVRQKIIEDLSVLTHLSADDPPIYMSYEMRPDDPVPTERTLNWQIHHVTFGIKLKERADELGLSTNLTYPGAASPYSSVAEFFRATLQ